MKNTEELGRRLGNVIAVVLCFGLFILSVYYAVTGSMFAAIYSLNFALAWDLKMFMNRRLP